MAVNMYYGDPFGAALQGKLAAIKSVTELGDAARRQRGEDLSYDYLKWYQPLQQAQAQNSVGQELLKNAALHAHATGDMTQYNQVLAQYFGSAATPVYNATTTPEQRSMGADVSAGTMGAAFTHPGFYVGGGAQRTGAGLPGGAAASSPGPYGAEHPELNAAYFANELRRLSPDQGNGQNTPGLPQLNFGPPQAVAPQPFTQAPSAPGNPAGEGAFGSGVVKAGPAQVNPANAASFYGVPKTPKSIWDNEYTGGSDGTQ